MAICVNGVHISAAAVERELASHAGAANPRQAAIEALVLRELLLQTARSTLAEASGVLQGIGEKPNDEAGAFVEEALIERLIEREVGKPELSDLECATFYENNPAQFRSGDLVEASHILFEAAPRQLSDALRRKTATVLQQALQDPGQFAELARQHSDCTSAAVGGSLGQLSRGDTVPEFERVAFSLAAGEIARELVETRFGLHIVMVAHRAQGRIFPFEMVREKLAAHLLEQKGRRALRQYMKGLVAREDIQGAGFDAA